MKGIRGMFRRAACVALLAAAAQLAGPALARADAGEDPATRLLKYAGCALGIAGAASGFGLAGAIIICGVLFMKEA